MPFEFSVTVLIFMLIIYHQQFLWKFYLAVKISFTFILLNNKITHLLLILLQVISFRHKGFTFSQNQVLLEVTAIASRFC